MRFNIRTDGNRDLEPDFKDTALRRIEAEADYNGDLGDVIADRFRRRMQQIRAAVDERDFYANKGMHFEKLEGKRQHQRSIRLNDQWRLIIEITGEAPNKRVLIVGVEDYH